MLRNERQYRITTGHAARFEESLTELLKHQTDATPPSILTLAQTDALRCQLADLKAAITEYEALKSGGGRNFPN